MVDGGGCVAVGRLEPLVAAQQHRLRQVERGVSRVRRKGDDRVGDRDFVVVEAGALRAEQNAVLLAGSEAGRAHGGARGQDSFRLPRSRAVAA